MALPSISPSAMRPVAQYLRGRGVDVASVLRGCAMQPAWLDDRDLRIPVTVTDRMWEEAALACGDSRLALHVAEGVQTGTFGLLTYLVGNSATWGDALRRLSEHYDVLSEGASYQLQVDHDRAFLRVALHRPGPSSRQSAEFALAVVQCLAGKRVEGWNLRCVHIQHEAPDDPSEHHRVFDARVVFGAAQHALEFDADLLEMPLREPDLGLLTLLDELVSSKRRRAQEAPWSERVRGAVAAQLPAGRHPDLARVARLLGVGERTLRRRLASEGASFAELVDSARRSLAEEQLSAGRMPIPEIARLAGYSGPRALNRAFLRWNGMTAQAYRRVTTGSTG